MTVISDFPIGKAARYSGLTVTMVDYLCRTEVLVPSINGERKRGRGIPRLYSYNDILLLKSIKSLLDKGISVKRLKKGLIEMQRINNRAGKYAILGGYLVTDGKECFLFNGEEHLRDLDGSNQMSFSFIINISSIKSELDADLAKKGGYAFSSS